jgi:SLA1 homology domain 1, SHD1
LEAKADLPIRGRFDKPDAKLGPDGQVEVVYRPQFKDPPYPPTSKTLTRVNDLKVGAEIWIQDGFRTWYRGNVLGIDGLRAMVHVHGRDPVTDELTPIPRIRLAADTEQPAADDGKNPFEDVVPPRKRTWTDTTGKFKIQAEFIKLAAGKVTLKREDGSEIALPLEMLAAGDQQIARQLGGM